MTEALLISAAPSLLLRPILQQARDGALAPDWREKLLERVKTAAAAALADLPPQDWEPGRGVGWRRAIDAWHTAMIDCLADAARADDELLVRLPLAAGDQPERWEMDRDLATGSYRAGLAAGGLDVEWFDWLIERTTGWPDRERARDQIDAMTLEMDYRANMERLPLYWA